MLTEDEIFLAIDNVPITNKYVVDVGRAIERAVLAKHAQLLNDLTIERNGDGLWLRVCSDHRVGAFNLGHCHTGNGPTIAGAALVHWFMRKQSVLHGGADPAGVRRLGVRRDPVLRTA